ncbi:hypothetical protein OIU77_017514 [Salix suchowensis]|uniref:UspA domain-containing protein n=1 Tax=Salix suchowensis TaxID=1278906 RepID=A0ABQ8ZPP0_9ROSI|nr:hypothetical protein OIU77_017514 [Salix suchowensis]
MNSKQPHKSESDLPVPPLPTLPRLHSPNSTSNRRVAIAVDLSDESAYAVKWAVENYLRPGDAVILLHVRPTSVLYGADWGSIQLQINNNNTPFELMKDHDMKERLCLEVERLGLSAVIMGSRDFGATRKKGISKGGSVGGGRLGSVSDYCVQHCVCPVVVVRCSDDGKDGV